MAKQLVIDSFIGRWGYSQQMVRQWLNQSPKGEKNTLIVSSLGGELDHGTAIYDMLAERKDDIDAKLTGFNASAATYIVLPVHTSISSTAFYLIHKALSWVDEWGMMNEDDLDEVIKKLTDKKEENQRITLVLAKHYLKRASKKGKTLNDVLDLMKKDTWLTATDALEWGFVDEVHEAGEGEISNAKSLLNEENFQYMNSIGLPSFPTRAGADLQSVPPITQTPTNPINNMHKELVLPQINAVLNLQVLNVTDDGSFLSEEMVLNIEQELVTRQTRISELETSEQSLQNSLAERDNTITSQQERITTLETEAASRTADTQDQERISALEAQLTAVNEKHAALILNIEKTPAGKALLFQSSKENTGKSDGVDWDTMAALPHNQFVDNNL